MRSVLGLTPHPEFSSCQFLVECNNARSYELANFFEIMEGNTVFQTAKPALLAVTQE